MGFSIFLWETQKFLADFSLQSSQVIWNTVLLYVIEEKIWSIWKLSKVGCGKWHIVFVQSLSEFYLTSRTSISGNLNPKFTFKFTPYIVIYPCRKPQKRESIVSYTLLDKRVNSISIKPPWSLLLFSLSRCETPFHCHGQYIRSYMNPSSSPPHPQGPYRKINPEMNVHPSTWPTLTEPNKRYPKHQS